MYYVYLLQSIKDSSKVYTGYTTDLKVRLKYHNEGANKFSKVFAPWKIVWYCAFSNMSKAKEFEKYLKSASGIAFRRKHFHQQKL